MAEQLAGGGKTWPLNRRAGDNKPPGPGSSVPGNHSRNTGKTPPDTDSDPKSTAAEPQVGAQKGPPMAAAAKGGLTLSHPSQPASEQQQQVAPEHTAPVIVEDPFAVPALTVQQASPEPQPAGSSSADGGDNSAHQQDFLTPQLDDDHDDDTSQASSEPSPRAGRRNRDTGSEEESISVDCHTNPSEVIVRGANVKKVRVKFAQPPKTPRESSNRPRSVHRSSSAHHLRSLCRHGSADDENLPMSQEETGTPAEVHPTTSKHPSMSSLRSYSVVPVPAAAAAAGGGSSSLSSIDNSSLALSCEAINWDLKYRQDIQAALQYFQQKDYNLEETIHHLTLQLEQVKNVNGDLEQTLASLRCSNQRLVDETDELKIRLDQSEKENQQLTEQTLSQWTAKVKLEEMYMNMKRESETEIAQLRGMLRERENTLPPLNVPKESSSSHRDEAVNRELRLSISRLEESLQAAVRDTDTQTSANYRLKQDVTDLKGQLRVKSQELESQYKRFLSLKKSFNDIMEENEKIRSQLRVRRGSIGGNSTWPKASAAGTASGTLKGGHTVPAAAGVAAESETLRLIDLPGSSQPAVQSSTSTALHRGATGSSKAAQGSVTGPKLKPLANRRNKSDGLSMHDNLPLVSNVTR